MSILNNSVVTFRPGIYFVKDGKFFVDSNAKVQGDGVVSTRLETTRRCISPAIRESISPRLRPVPWLEFFSSRTAARRSSASIISIATASPGRRVPCTCHAAFFSTDSNSTIAANSAFTNVVARKVWIKSNASLTLNADYGATSVPNVAVYYEGVEAVWLVK
ncbi:hypothetical protein [Mesorhizobium sp.]|uniref:hypothetical protein n=1 Tax=Mesorhizobium sp. TaxID=1871066 RepID=UPI001201A694|nr:hypothetical protein [Mesorhizobium sp.]TIL30284.1 MAG: hypothetical protein E5Y85_24715 [Mesorhizobium sp.]TIL50904.1 MAG: hypothetical protein E5Y83_20565 [Mesorhizobium sp.]